MSSQTKRKKAPPALGIENYRAEILLEYCHNNRKLRELPKIFNDRYKLTYTYNQYVRAIEKWGGRKNIPNSDLLGLVQLVNSQDAPSERESMVLLNKDTILSKRSMKRRTRRLTYTDQVFRLAEQRQNAQVNAIGSNSTLMAHPLMRDDDFRIRLKTIISDTVMYALPMPQIKNILWKELEKLKISNTTVECQGNRELSTVLTDESFVVISLIVSYFSNDDRWPFIHEQLNQLTSFRSRQFFKRFIRENAASMQAVCKNILLTLYIRGDENLITWIRDSYVSIEIDLYKILDGCVRNVSYITFINRNSEIYFNLFSEFWTPIPQTADSKSYSIHTPIVINHLMATEARPKTIFEAKTLLFACKAVLNDLGPFFKLWDKKKWTVKDMETSDDWTRQFRLLPLFTDNADHIERLYENGFRLGATHMFLGAILKGNKAATERWLRCFSWHRIKPGSGMCSNGVRVTMDDLRDPDTINEILAAAAQEASDLGARIPQGCQGQTFSWHDHLTFYFGSSRGYITDIAIQILQSKYPGPRDVPKENLHHAINCFSVGGYYRSEEEYIDFDYPLRLWGRVGFYNSLRMIKETFKLGIDPSTMKIWPSMWKHFLERAQHSQIYDTELVTAFLDAGEEYENGLIDKSINFQYRFNETPTLDEVCAPARKIGLGDRTPLALAFYLSRSDLFYLLISRNAYINLDLFLGKKRELEGKSREFLEAVEERDEGKIKTLWNIRLSILKIKPIDLRVLGEGNGFKIVVQQILETYGATATFRGGAFWHFVEYTAKLRLNVESHTEHYQECLNVTRYLVNPGDVDITNNTWYSSHLAIQESFHSDHAKDIMRQVIFQGKSELFELLLSCPAGAKAWNDFGYVEASFVDQAARCSLKCLEILAKLGVTIPAAESAGAQPLKHPIEANDTEMIRYLLSEAAEINDGRVRHKVFISWDLSGERREPGVAFENMEFPYILVTPLEHAIYRQRIDIVTLFLEVYPNYYDEAIHAAEKYGLDIMKTHIQNWGSTSGKVSGDRGL